MNTPLADRISAAQAEAEDSHDKAQGGFTFLGEQLQPYTPSRRAAAQACGLIYPFVPESGAAQFEATGMYPGMLVDICLVIWACTLPDSIDLTKEEIQAGTWTPTRMLGRREAALEAALAWAEGNRVIDTISPQFREAQQLFIAIVQNVAAAEFKLQVESGGSESPEVSREEESEGGNV